MLPVADTIMAFGFTQGATDMRISEIKRSNPEIAKSLVEIQVNGVGNAKLCADLNTAMQIILALPLYLPRSKIDEIAKDIIGQLRGEASLLTSLRQHNDEMCQGKGNEGSLHLQAKELVIQQLPTVKVKCDQCARLHNIELKTLATNRCAKLKKEKGWNGFRLDLALVYNNDVICAFEVLSTSKISEKKRTALLQSGIPWCEVYAHSIVHTLQTTSQNEIFAARGSLCPKCNSTLNQTNKVWSCSVSSNETSDDESQRDGESSDEDKVYEMLTLCRQEYKKLKNRNRYLEAENRKLRARQWPFNS
tara:strand:- start:695 stop:1609 length:915 start_codon:yes stop_codon:yes gene_type:complete